ncbi:MAG: phosphoribosyltransferase [Actinomycetota bacterium]|nr:phosphoribosyltransferase [Actinomycetota bacterium]
MFKDRRDAGERLAHRLEREQLENPVVLALPRGGIPVGDVVAAALGAAFEPFVARKLGAPGHAEFGIGAIAEGSDDVVVSDAAARLGLTHDDLAQQADAERPEVERRVSTYRGGRPLPPLEGRDVLLVDDGLATGVTAEAALGALRHRNPRRLILAVPVCAPDTAGRLGALADEVICLEAPEDFAAVGRWYDRFDQITDDEVLEILDKHGERAADHQPELTSRAVEIDVDGHDVLLGDLTVPASATGVVVFAHGSGSGRGSPRNRSVASALQARGIGTLLVDLLTEDEQRMDEETGQLRFDIVHLAGRLGLATRWLVGQPSASGLPLGYFGASTGAAAALVEASRSAAPIAAVVSRGGRPDLAGDALSRVTAPTLLVVGGADTTVLQLTEQAAPRLAGEHRLEVVPGATHLFEEPGALAEVARLACDWFVRWLPGYPTG